MKLIHLSDLHIGKKVNEFSMVEDQKYIFGKILQIIEAEAPQGILLAGDIYDKTVPSAEGVSLFDDFLTRLSQKNIPLFIISGNHDSAERLSFGRKIMTSRQVYFSPVFGGKIEPLILEDEFGEVAIFLLPFIKPAHVRKVYPEKDMDSYEDAVKTVIDDMEISPDRRNVLVAHQFVTGATTCESEDISLGGTNNISGDLFRDFDYVALGHLHGPQTMGRDTLRYCGSPLKYSFSEANHTKSVTVVELKEKYDIVVRTIPLKPLRDMRVIRGEYNDIANKSFYDGMKTDDYFHIVLTDEDDVGDALGKLRSIYPNIMRLTYDNARTRQHQQIRGLDQGRMDSPMDILEEFYRLQNNQPMDEKQKKLAAELIEKIKGEDK